MNKKILLGCYEVPGYGGASTAAYSLFEKMQKDAYQVHYMNLIEEQDVDYYGFALGQDFGNPKHLKNVETVVLGNPLYGEHPELTQRIQEISPDLLIGAGFIASLVMKRATPEKKLVFVTTGCQQMKDSIVRRKARTFAHLKENLESALGRPDISSREEEAAVDSCDLIVTHSEMTLFLYEKFFPFHSGKIYSEVIWFAEWIYEESLEHLRFAKPFSEREIDVLFISSSWNRPEKNYQFVQKIARKLKNVTTHVVGETEENSIPAVFHGLLRNRQELFALMGNSKTVVCPSSFDAAPGILFEASAVQCNVVTSRNCGNWHLCNELLLVDPFTPENFAQKISLSLTRKFPDNIGWFLDKNSYRNLLETISVVD
ncbi:glycosyltransferase [bacterium]|nr:glycosyltransferase [bacterium]